jgi:transcriptional regulator with XRE-family HTH domain
MVLGAKIRGVRELKGLTQENLAAMLGVTLPTYADIERGKKDVPMKRLEQVAEKLGVSVIDILKFGETVSNFFDQCKNTNVVANNNGSNTNNNYDSVELQHKLDKANLEIDKLKAELELAQLKQKYENG